MLERWGNASPAWNGSAPFEIIHNGRCIPAKLGCYSARINQSNRVLKPPPVVRFSIRRGVGGMWRGRGAWAQARRWAHVGRNSARMRAHEGARGRMVGRTRRALSARVGSSSRGGKAQRAIAISSAGARVACSLPRDCLRSARVRSSWRVGGCAPAVRAWRGHAQGV